MAAMISFRWCYVWQRNFLVWRKMAIPALLGSLLDPMIYMFGLGYGLGSLLPQVEGAPYIAFLGAGTVCASTMNAGSFEALYSAFSRMQVQRTWDAIVNAPIALEDVVLGEWVWAATRATLAGSAILLVMALLGLIHSWVALWALPVIFLIGLTFAALGLIVTAVAPGYDFFMYYFTLVITPMTLLSGVFFPISQLPPLAQHLTGILPLGHAVAVIRPLLLGGTPEAVFSHLGILAITTALALTLALRMARRRLMG
jgi:lipooligosaccharide transport system permease protein